MADVYLAGPIFTDAETTWLRAIKGGLESRSGGLITVIWPFESTPGSSSDRASRVLDICRAGLDAADLLVAVLDGPQVDDGTAWEIGYFYHRHGGSEQIIGLRTDIRKAGETAGIPVNTLVGASCGAIVGSVAELNSAIDHLVHIPTTP